MKTSHFLSVLIAGIALAAGSIPASAAYVDNDIFTRDTSSGLDWLDLSTTSGLTTDAALAGNTGWRLATQGEVRSLVHDFFGLSDADFQPEGYFVSHEQHYVDKSVAWHSLFGQSTSAAYHQVFALGQHFSYGRYNDAISGQGLFAGTRGDDDDGPYFFLDRHWEHGGPPVTLTEADYSGVFLVRPSVVPVPAAAWLFGSGLIGLGATARRKAKST